MAGKIRVGIWGLGRAGNGMHIPELRQFPDQYEIVAGCDIDADRRAAAQKKLPDAKIYATPEEFLSDPNIELVNVATRSPDHVKHAIEAVKAGKMVMVEKPVACRIEDALELRKVAEANPGKVYIRHNRRFEAAFSHIREIIKSGKLGNVFEIKLCRHNYQWRADWQTILEHGGGQLLNWGPHLVDHALRFLESPVKEMWSDLAIVASRGDAEDHVKIVLKGENGRVVDVEISGGASLGDPIYAVRGSRGSLMSWDEKRLKLKYLAPGYPVCETPADPGNPPLEGGFGGKLSPVWVEDDLGVAPSNGDRPEMIWNYLYETIRLGKPYPITIDEAVEVVRVIDLVKKTPIRDVR